MFNRSEEESGDWENLVMMRETSSLLNPSGPVDGTDYLSVDDPSRNRERELNLRFITEIFEEV